jgi:hypothetical protein
VSAFDDQEDPLGVRVAQNIRDLTLSDLRLFGDIVARLERIDGDLNVRAAVFGDIVKLVRAVFCRILCVE